MFWGSVVGSILGSMIGRPEAHMDKKQPISVRSVDVARATTRRLLKRAQKTRKRIARKLG